MGNTTASESTLGPDDGSAAWKERAIRARWFGERPDRCAVCGGLNPGDVSHTRCASNGYEGLE